MSICYNRGKATTRYNGTKTDTVQRKGRKLEWGWSFYCVPTIIAQLIQPVTKTLS